MRVSCKLNGVSDALPLYAMIYSKGGTLKKKVLIVISALILIALVQRSYIYLYPRVTGYPMISKADKLIVPYIDDISMIDIKDYDVFVNEDDLFKLSLYIQKKQAKEYRHISIFSTLEYVGSNTSIEIWSGTPYYGYSIRKGETEYHMDMILTEYGRQKLVKNQIYVLPLRKSICHSESDEDALYWKAYSKDEYLRLPIGEYDLNLRLDFDIGENGENYQETIYQEITVEE